MTMPRISAAPAPTQRDLLSIPSSALSR
jgi:hypothetical protein